LTLRRLTYLVEAIQPGYNPAADNPVLAVERVAMVRSLVYGGVRFWVMPTVQSEYDKIRDPSRHLRHQRTAWILLHDAPVEAPPGAVEARASELQAFHPQAHDCRIVAEGERAGLSELVTFDEELIAHLTRHTPLALTRPSTFWQSLGIGPGAVPALQPGPSNPLAHVDWWRL
jgi:hypothetical protein